MTENNGMDRDDTEQDSESNNPYEDLLNELAVVAGTMSVRQEYPSDYGVQQSGLFYIGLMLCRRLMMLSEQIESVAAVIDNNAELILDLEVTTKANTEQLCLRLEAIETALENIAACMPHE